MRFGLGTYFDKLDISEAIGHEIAEARSRRAGEITGRDLPFRSLVGDPFDFRRRAVLPAVTTLTLRRAKAGASFLLHWRDPRKVAMAAGISDQGRPAIPHANSSASRSDAIYCSIASSERLQAHQLTPRSRIWSAPATSLLLRPCHAQHQDGRRIGERQ
jgi:hypothetical protein